LESFKNAREFIITNKMREFKEVENNVISLIHLDEKYLHDMWEYSKNEKLYEHFEYECHKNIKETSRYLKKLIHDSDGINCHVYFIKLKEINKVIGSINIHKIDRKRESCHIGYAISPDFWGKGIFASALDLCLDELVKYHKMYRITALTSQENIRSIKSLQKKGFITEGTLKNFYKDSNGRRFNALLLTLIND